MLTEVYITAPFSMRLNSDAPWFNFVSWLLICSFWWICAVITDHVVAIRKYRYEGYALFFVKKKDYYKKCIFYYKWIKYPHNFTYNFIFLYFVWSYFHFLLFFFRLTFSIVISPFLLINYLILSPYIWQANIINWKSYIKRIKKTKKKHR